MQEMLVRAFAFRDMSNVATRSEDDGIKKGQSI